MTPAQRRTLSSAALLALAPTTFATPQQFQLQPVFPGTPRWTEGVECADVDEDGDLDLFFADGDGFQSAGTQRQNILIINQLIEIGPGSFADESVARLGVQLSNGKGVATGDVDGDTWVDALFANAFNTDTPFLYINQGAANPGFFDMESATRGFTSSYSSGGAQFGDLDNDGDLDVIISDAYLGSAATRPHLFSNDGTGVFTENASALSAVSKSAQMDVQFIDVDNDWDLDFFGACRAANAGGAHYLMLNDGQGNFSDVSSLITSSSGNTYEADCGDLDGDQDIDLFFVSLVGFGEGAIRNNQVPNGTLSFSNQAQLTGTVDDNEIALFDWDNDADYDVFVGSLGTHEYLWQNNGSLSFANISMGNISFLSDSTLDCTVADLDNDGRYDLVTAQGESNPGQYADKWYMNTGNADNLPPVIVEVDAPTVIPPGTLIARAKIRDQVIDDGRNWVTGVARFVVNNAAVPSVVSIDPTGFNPSVLTIPAGTHVIWSNNSGGDQSVDLDSPPYIADSGTIGTPGGSYEYVFVTPGTYDYSSSFSGSIGQVIVTGSATAVDATYSGGQIYRFAMNATGGDEIVYDLEFTDWAGNSSVTSNLGADILTCPAPTTYCTPKLNSIGCTPSIGFAGSPSASAGSGFDITASNVINNKSGLLFYGTNGPAGIPFQGGYLCVKAPVVRTSVQGSAGNPPPNDCSGTYSLDFNVRIAAGVDPDLVAGAAVHTQYWARDPGFGPPNNTSLTDGLSFTICP